MQRTEAIVHLDRLKRNIERVQAILRPGVELIAVLKGDAYGHGISGVYPLFHTCGIQTYAVAIWQEGAALRAAGAETENIFILGDTWDEDLEQILRYRLTPTIFSYDTACKLNAIAEQQAVIQPINIKIDTGMNRIGYQVSEAAADEICRIAALPHLEAAGIFTHFARADETDSDATDKQLQRFQTMLNDLRERGLTIPLIHLANSAAILFRPDVQYQAVRAGDILYGLCPVDEDTWKTSGYEEVMTWETYVVMVKTVPQGQAIGYGGTFMTKRETKVATLPVGFSDGYNRHLSNRGYVVINGQKAPILGRVCMDQMMVDVTDIANVARGTVVHLLDSDQISILKMADLLDSNVDEIVTGISKRVPKRYDPACTCSELRMVKSSCL